jgi:hypothetical protein
MNADNSDQKSGVEGDNPGIESYKPFGIIVGGRGRGTFIIRPRTGGPGVSLIVSLLAV